MNMEFARAAGIAIVVMSPAVGAYAADGLQKQIDPQAQKMVVETIQKLKSKKINEQDKIKLLAALGELGPDAAPALPFLLSEEFYVRTAQRNTALKQATIDVLIRIGEPAVPAILSLLKPQAAQKSINIPKNADPATTKSLQKQQAKAASRAKQAKEARELMVRDLFLELSRRGFVDPLASALQRDLRASKGNLVYGKRGFNRNAIIDLLALLGAKSVPVLKREAERDASGVRQVAGAIGPEIGDAVDAIISEHYNDTTWADKRFWIHYHAGFWPLAHAKPDPKHIPAFLDLIKNDGLMGRYYGRGVRLTGMLLSGMGQSPALPLANLLEDENPRIRWAAATILAMIGPDMKAALPALENTFTDKDEDIGVRVASARAIADIKGIDGSKLCERIPDVQRRIVELSRRNREASQSPELWQQHFAADPETTAARQLALYNLTTEFEKPLYDLATGQNLKAQNQWLREYAADKLANLPPVFPSLTGHVLGSEAHTFLLLFGSGSRHYPGRLEPDVEKAFKEICFKALDITRIANKPRYLPKSTDVLDKLLALDDSLSILEMSNGPMRNDANQYLILQVLKDDPAYKDRTFKTGDTVSQRYDAFTKFIKRGLKSLALHGMWAELGSSNYEHKTYRGLLALLDYATDPIVAARARMFMDLAMVEVEQISLSGLRGGSKTRAKDGGLTGRFNRTRAMLHGEHHGFILEPPGFKHSYQPPVPAVLLRRLGPTKPVYEIVNRHVSENESLEEKYVPQYKRVFKLPSRSINYAYCTPDYVTGCAMFDVRLWRGEGKEKSLKYGTMGRWSGVIFRNRGAVYLEAYTTDKWYVQSKDVLIAQIFKDARYPGHPRVDFASIMEMVEKDGWVFVNNHDAHAAVRVVRGGYYWNEPARHRLYLNDWFSPIIVQTGRKAVYGSFAAFQDGILNAPLTLTDDKLDYTGPNSSRIEFFLAKDSDDDPYPESLPKIDGTELDLNLEYNYRSPYMENKVSSDIVTVRYGKRRWEYDFAKNTVTEIKE